MQLVDLKTQNTALKSSADARIQPPVSADRTEAGRYRVVAASRMAVCR
jgi:hypothetical protein